MRHSQAKLNAVVVSLFAGFLYGMAPIAASVLLRFQ